MEALSQPLSGRSPVQGGVMSELFPRPVLKRPLVIIHWDFRETPRQTFLRKMRKVPRGPARILPFKRRQVLGA
jgi:hypothetical protein